MRAAGGHRRLLFRLGLMVVASFGFGFALVPLYDVFCDITGLNGKTATGPVAVAETAEVSERRVVVEFVANLNVGAPWEFRPETVRMVVQPGKMYQTSYFARNRTGEQRVAQAVPSVSPGQVARYFNKTECFCFTRQVFEAGEGRDMPLAFMVDPDLPEDVGTLTLSYTFFNIDEGSS